MNFPRQQICCNHSLLWLFYSSQWTDESHFQFSATAKTREEDIHFVQESRICHWKNGSGVWGKRIWDVLKWIEASETHGLIGEVSKQPWGVGWLRQISWAQMSNRIYLSDFNGVYSHIIIWSDNYIIAHAMAMGVRTDIATNREFGFSMFLPHYTFINMHFNIIYYDYITCVAAPVPGDCTTDVHAEMHPYFR